VSKITATDDGELAHQGSMEGFHISTALPNYHRQRQETSNSIDSSSLRCTTSLYPLPQREWPVRSAWHDSKARVKSLNSVLILNEEEWRMRNGRCLKVVQVHKQPHNLSSDT